MRTAILLAFALAAPSWIVAQKPDARAIAKRVDQHYNRLHSLRAHFTERYRGMGMDRTESGTLLLEKPGKMRWTYDVPRGKVFVMDGKSAVLYSPGNASAQKLPAKEIEDLRSPLRFLLGRAHLEKELGPLSLTLVSLPSGGTGYTMSGVPRGLGARVRSIAVTATSTGMILAMRVTEQSGDTTDFALSEEESNSPVHEDDFRFVPPKGVGLLDSPKPVR